MAVKSVKEVVEDLLTRVKKLEDEESGGGSDDNVVKYASTTFESLKTSSSSSSTISAGSHMELLNVEYSQINSACGTSLTTVKDVIGLSFFLDGSLSGYVVCSWHYEDEDPGYYTLSVMGHNTNTTNSATVTSSSVVVIFYKS